MGEKGRKEAEEHEHKRRSIDGYSQQHRSVITRSSSKHTHTHTTTHTHTLSLSLSLSLSHSHTLTHSPVCSQKPAGFEHTVHSGSPEGVRISGAGLEALLRTKALSWWAVFVCSSWKESDPWLSGSELRVVWVAGSSAA